MISIAIETYAQIKFSIIHRAMKNFLYDFQSLCVANQVIVLIWQCLEICCSFLFPNFLANCYGLIKIRGREVHIRQRLYFLLVNLEMFIFLNVSYCCLELITFWIYFGIHLLVDQKWHNLHFVDCFMLNLSIFNAVLIFGVFLVCYQTVWGLKEVDKVWWGSYWRFLNLIWL